MKTDKYHYRPSGITRRRFNPALLADPHKVLRHLNIFYGKINSDGYWKLYCPFHNDTKRSKPSLNLHHIDGHFFCDLCGESGNILDFYMQVTGKGFLKASTELGAWELR